MPAPTATRRTVLTGSVLAAALTAAERVGLRGDAVSVMATGLDDPYVDRGVDQGRVRRPLGIDQTRSWPGGWTDGRCSPAGSTSPASRGWARWRCPAQN